MWKHFVGLNHHALHGFQAKCFLSWMHEFTCIHAFTHSNTHLMCGLRKEIQRLHRRSTRNDSLMGICWIAKHFNVFMRRATLCASRLFYKAKHDMGNESYHRILAMKETVLRRIWYSLSTGSRAVRCVNVHKI